jgi:hypothetical protein
MQTKMTCQNRCSTEETEEKKTKTRTMNGHKLPLELLKSCQKSKQNTNGIFGIAELSPILYEIKTNALHQLLAKHVIGSTSLLAMCEHGNKKRMYPFINKCEHHRLSTYWWWLIENPCASIFVLSSRSWSNCCILLNLKQS